MVNEAVLVTRLEDPIDFAVADATAMTKGQINRLTDNRTASAGTGVSGAIAGIAARDKVASDGRTQLAHYLRGVFRLKFSGAGSTGEAVYPDAQIASNYVRSAQTTGVTNLSGAVCIGYLLEDVADNAYAEVLVNIQPGLGA